MSQNQPPVPPAVHGALRASGFLLQTRVIHDLRAARKWDVLASEYPWVDPSDKDQFLDILIRQQIGQEINYIGIECKKTDTEAYTFLVPRPRTDPGTGTIALVTEGTADDSGRVATYCGRQHIAPESFDAEFCVVAKDAKNQRLLEGDARLVTQATEAVALAEHRRLNASATVGTRQYVFTLYTAMIVTNALLYAAHYDPKTVSLASGHIGPDPQLTQVPWIRFTKPLSGRRGPDVASRTVFVVAAESLLEFLGRFEVFDPTRDMGPVLFGPHS